MPVIDDRRTRGLEAFIIRMFDNKLRSFIEFSLVRPQTHGEEKYSLIFSLNRVVKPFIEGAA